ncbi:unnamed protein product [Adineta steineri]|uniref:Brix domain-containing protein n=1 Tax=Adineta steineri TaxID=433720 RepID=A0A814ST01_9BILA|nr:unnamed protein product [Adineta steineri]CAF1152472.1 unnamed protein product [Adineta steineri]CAF1262213.1 unnamed protein product [Adineta steineri]CAF1323825.1 unnamed protein product [Adineta steineri]CAF1386477.1 unnamed protein product [Adineta steineri]
MGKKQRGRAARNARRKLPPNFENEEVKRAPHVLVFKRGTTVGNNVKELIRDMRRVMEPFTAPNLKVSRKNGLKDFIAISGHFHVTHLMTFSKTQLSTYMRLIRIPRGPTLNFRIRRFTHSRDIVSQLKRPQTFPKQFEHAPLLVMNGFQDDSIQIKLIATMFQNMFPSINVTNVDLSTIKRCVLLSLDPVNGFIEFRHYNIKIAPSGISRAAKKLLQGKVPDLSRFNDISDFMYREGNASESEDESTGNPDENEVILSQQLRSRGNLKSNQSAIRLTEIGPRMTLELVKIEDGLCDGEVLYHTHISKTPEEIAELRKRTSDKKRLKEQRKREQEANVKRKEETKKNTQKNSSQQDEEDHMDEASNDYEE